MPSTPSFFWFGLALVVFAEMLTLHRRPPAPAPAPSPVPRAQNVALALVVVGVAAVRLKSIFRFEPSTGELLELTRSRYAHIAPTDFASLLHAPLHAVVMHQWCGLVDSLHLPPTLPWIRAPNVAFSALLALLLGRIGRRVGSPSAGLGAAVLYGASPLMFGLHAYQENYLLEVLGGAFFVERLAAYALGARPAPRSLGVAAACALWSGYMNGLALGFGALTFLALAARRRDLRSLLLTGGWALGLSLPVLGSALRASAGLHALSQGGPGRSGAVESLRHPVMPVANAFGGGDAAFFLSNLVGVAVGSLAPLLLAGVVALIARRVRPAWFPVALILATMLAGVRLPFQLSNLASVVLCVMFLACWGSDVLLRWATARRPRLAALQFALWAAFSVAVHANWPHIRESRSPTFYGGGPVFQRVLSAAPRDQPVLIFGEPIPDQQFWLLCADAASIAARLECLAHSRMAQPGTAWTLRQVFGREVAVPTTDMNSPPRSVPLGPDVPVLVGRPAWRRGYLVFRGHGSQGDAAVDTEPVAAFLAPRCRVVAATVRYEIEQCAGAAPSR